MSSSSSIATCSSTTLSALLTNQYIEQCSTDSGYQFTAASIPTQDVIDLMCASSSCRSLLADAQAMDLSECILPVGDNIRLLADLIDYVPARCPSASGSAATTAGSTSNGTSASTVTASSTSGNTTESSSNTVTVPSSSSSGETSTTATSSPSTQTSASASASAASASSGSSAASPVGRTLSVMTLGALAVVTYFL
ncbi:Elicitin [Phytophthora megakarya]|uniref:Elicitin n=1 Tax=Phytophthora megakarya TaxID=4795 RepID=A0A225X3P5_9STRA|nr:Elicitin [Phytophthora megakarya]